MGVFDKIKGAIWGKAEAAEPEVQPAPSADKSAGTESAATSPAAGNVDVAAILDAAAKNSGQTLNWRSSIVDLMKALGLDSSLAHRKELAQELGYSGELDGSAEMNMWLHNQVIQKLKENGGKVPADL